MTEDSANVLEALTRGRLIFPFMEEMNALRDEAKAGPLLGSEKGRLAEIEAAYKEFAVHDEKFHAAYVSGNLDAAQMHAEMALRVVAGLADA